VVLLDQTMSDGLDQVRRLQRVSSRPKVIALGMPDQEEMLLEWAEAGVSGFVPRDASVEDLVSTVESAVRGEFHCTAKLAGTLLRRLACRPSAASIWGASERLTPRESEIVGLIDGGLSNKEIAVRLGIEVATVKNHVHNLLEKLRVRRRGEAAARLRSHEH
jgi:DNA-binding NarL/FixJ family response regulator